MWRRATWSGRADVVREGGGVLRSDCGSAIVVVVMAMFLLVALGSALVVTAATEARISARFGASAAALSAAEAALAIAVADLAIRADFDAALSGLVTSAFTDGPPAGVRTVAGSEIDLSRITNELRCGRDAVCTDADIAAVSAQRPWGADNPRWQTFAWGRLSTLTPRAGGANDMYLVAWVGDDPAEIDGDPQRDGVPAANAGRGIVMVIAHAYGAGGLRRAIEATITRARPADTAVVSWREIR